MPRGIPKSNGRSLTPIQLFERKIKKTPKCWLWTASTGAGGYGSHGSSGLDTKAHRAAWQLYKGPIPRGLHVLHKCDNRACVKPSHPDRQPGMTGEDVERVAKAMWDRTHDEPWPGDPGDIAPQIYRDDARTAIAAIKRASQRQ